MKSSLLIIIWTKIVTIYSALKEHHRHCQSRLIQNEAQQIMKVRNEHHTLKVENRRYLILIKVENRLLKRVEKVTNRQSRKNRTNRNRQVVLSF